MRREELSDLPDNAENLEKLSAQKNTLVPFIGVKFSSHCCMVA